MSTEPAIARVVEEHKTQYVIRTDEREYAAVVRGKFLLDTGMPDFPKVGDYVEFSHVSEGQAVIERILPRTTQIVRKASGSNRPQVIVANVDLLFIVMGLDADFNLRRMERYLLLAQQSKVRPIILLNKSDVANDIDASIKELSKISGVVPIHAISAVTGAGINELMQYFTDDTTVVLLGSSGAGKSTITNRLLGQERQSTREVRADDGRGRHTTTHRELFRLPNGGYLIDTPGMRELGIFNTGAAESEVFADIENLIAQCAYPDCDHSKNRGCAVQNAIYDGVLDAKHFASYLKLKKEQEYLQSKIGGDSTVEHKHKVKNIQKQYKKKQRNKYSEQ